MIYQNKMKINNQLLKMAIYKMKEIKIKIIKTIKI